MSKFKERFLVKMKEWQESDKSSTKLFSTEYDRILAYLWANSKARKSDEKITEIKEFGSANHKAIDNYSKLLCTRDYCCCCGETFRLENLSICVDCNNKFCYRCNENICRCHGEIVG
ncbi:MAG: hypothetical protein AAFV71_32195 [Cyanobacteria bacterium J06633_8]